VDRIRPRRAGLGRRTAGAGAAVVVATLVLATTAPAGAAAVSDALRSTERAIIESKSAEARAAREAGRLAEERAALQQRMIALGAGILDSESALSALEATLAAARAEETSSAAALQRRRAQLIAALAAAMRIARRPPVAALGPGTAPADRVRSAILLRGAIPRLDRAAAELDRRIRRLAALRAGIVDKRKSIAATRRTLDAERARLNRLIARKDTLARSARARAAEAASRARALGERARDLRELMARIARAPPPARATAPVEDEIPDAATPPTPAPQTGDVAKPVPMPSILPARGRVVSSFGQDSGGGLNAKGIVIETRIAAQVISPADGTVVFAGPFRRYGQLLIIAHGGGYHTLLAGLARIVANVGDRLLAGEPVGEMGGSPNDKPTLYVELRREGRPINPLPWLSQLTSKVKG
jgi:murein hydrolase activator